MVFQNDLIGFEIVPAAGAQGFIFFVFCMFISRLNDFCCILLEQLQKRSCRQSSQSVLVLIQRLSRSDDPMNCNCIWVGCKHPAFVLRPQYMLGVMSSQCVMSY